MTDINKTTQAQDEISEDALENVAGGAKLPTVTTGGATMSQPAPAIPGAVPAPPPPSTVQ
jgi:hypothetical protein